MRAFASLLTVGLGLTAVSPIAAADADRMGGGPTDSVLVTIPARSGEAGIADVVVTPAGEVWWIDFGGHARSWSPDGRSRAWSIAEEVGTGRVRGLHEAPGGRFVVLLSDPHRVLVVTPEGAVHRRIELPDDLLRVGTVHVHQAGIYVSGYRRSEPGGQVHRVSTDRGLSSPVVIGTSRPTRNEDAFPYLQGGIVMGEREGRLLHAWINPLRIDLIDPLDGGVRTLVRNDFLQDGESEIYQVLDDGRVMLTNGHARVTGMIQDGNGQLLVSVFLPKQGSSHLIVFDAEGNLLRDRRLARSVSLRGQLPDGRLVVLRAMGQQEIVLIESP